MIQVASSRVAIYHLGCHIKRVSVNSILIIKYEKKSQIYIYKQKIMGIIENKKADNKNEKGSNDNVVSVYG